MTISFTRLLFIAICFSCFTLLLIVSCSKDVDALREAVILEEEINLTDTSNDTTTTTYVTPQEIVPVEENILGEPQEMEVRSTVFPSTQDAYLQNGQGYDQTIVRLEENNRTSYLMFDLSEIDSIGGEITSIDLEFVINTDDGSGTIEVFKGKSNEWTENTLTNKTAPETDVLLGSIANEFFVDNKVRIALDASQLNAGPSTLILDHKDGDDLAFASKENTTEFGPRLIVTYDAPVNAKILDIEILQHIEEDADEPIPEETTEETTTEETSDEDTTQEETVEEETTEETSTEETTTQEDTPEETTQEETTQEETTQEDTQEETTEEETTQEETTQEEPTEEEEITEETTQEETTEEEPAEDNNTPAPVVEQNEAPIAVAEASKISGVAPLEVNFNGTKSSDDEGISVYAWDFKDGTTANNASTTHTFQNSGTYSVALTVTDSKGLSHTSTVEISVSAPVNKAPVAVASANITSGPAPLLVNFTGSNSSDDNGITSYRWEFKDGSSSTEVNPSHTFNTSGTYNVDLFVTDAQGLTNFAGVTITVEQEVVVDNSCVTNGGFANTTGLKTWCWGDINVPSGASTGRDAFSGGQLALSVECSANQVVTEGDRLKFVLNPTTPEAASWCNNNFNMRSEIRTMPWNVDHATGTEEWFGFSYEWGSSYVADPTANTLFFQTHEGTAGENPLISLQTNGIATSKYRTGEIVIVNAANKSSLEVFNSNIIPQAGEKVDIVIHIVWGDNNTGLLQVWLNGSQVVNQQMRTVYTSTNVGGNAKFGLYKHVWRNEAGIQNSAANGVYGIETYLGALRVITRNSNDPEYKKDAYEQVRPR